MWGGGGESYLQASTFLTENKLKSYFGTKTCVILVIGKTACRHTFLHENKRKKIFFSNNGICREYNTCIPGQQKTISIISSFLRGLRRIRIDRSKPVLDLVLGENMDSGDSVLCISVPAFYAAL